MKPNTRAALATRPPADRWHHAAGSAPIGSVFFPDSSQILKRFFWDASGRKREAEGGGMKYNNRSIQRQSVFMAE